MDVPAISQARRTLYNAAGSLDEWGDTAQAVALRTAAEILGDARVLRHLRMEARIRDLKLDAPPDHQHETSEHDPLGPCRICGSDPLARYFERRRAAAADRGTVVTVADDGSTVVKPVDGA
jgi:hypothetical protein